MINPKNKLVAISNQNIEKEEFVSFGEVMKLLNVSKPTALNLLKECKNIKEVKGNGGSRKKLYNVNELNKIKSVKEQKELYTLENKGTKIANSFSPTEINVATDKMLNNIDFSKKENVMGFLENFSNLYMKVVDKAFDSKDLENKSLINENDRLKTKLGINENYYSVKRVSMINKKSQKDYNWRALKNKSFELGLEIKDEQDSNYGTVKSYHIRVWKEVYPNEKY